MTLVFATNNAHKLEEVRQILPSAYVVLSLKDIGFLSEIEETGDTLQANSLLKAQTVWDWISTHPSDKQIDGVFADDTGLEIPVLNNEPGVRTARWAGDEHNDAANRQKALTLLKDKNDRKAHFRTIITLISRFDLNKDIMIEQMEGRVDGCIADKEYGNKGFGYDSVFIPDGYQYTFAQLPAEVKNSISHRARAVEKLKKRLL